MAKATWEGKECDVRVDSDLGSNWSVSILSGEFDPVSLIQRPAAPVIIKVRAKTRWLALDQGLRSLKAQGKIADYSLEPRPAKEIAAEEAEKAKKKGGAKVEAEAEWTAWSDSGGRNRDSRTINRTQDASHGSARDRRRLRLRDMP